MELPGKIRSVYIILLLCIRLRMQGAAMWTKSCGISILLISALSSRRAGSREPYRVELDLPDGYQIALRIAIGRRLICTIGKGFLSIGQRVRCWLPKGLQKCEYQVRGVHFKYWMHGNLKPNWRRIRARFPAVFSGAESAMMRGFPEGAITIF